VPHIDTHAHLDFLEIDKLVPIEEINNKCIVKIHETFRGVIACLAFPSYFQSKDPANKIIEYFRRLKNEKVLGYQCGFHPNSCNKYTRQGLLDLVEIVRNKGCKVLAIGECGLDNKDKKCSMELQIAVFEDHIVVAHILELPMIFHFRGIDCLNTAFEVLKVFKSIFYLIIAKCGNLENIL
jgi:Tat protein secretion system quality control protein TatD with DNase activity